MYLIHPSTILGIKNRDQIKSQAALEILYWKLGSTTVTFNLVKNRVCLTEYNELYCIWCLRV